MHNRFEPAYIQTIMDQAQAAFTAYRKLHPETRAVFLDQIATEIENLGDMLIETASEETRLPPARLAGERGRTCFQLRMFAGLIREGSWLDAAIDTAQPDRVPLPKPDIRRMLVPLGPVVVFGASNFPMAYSTAGGDTASALAAGCSVVIKAHPAHPRTSQMVFEAMEKAAQTSGMPAFVVQHVAGDGFVWGKALVQHPLTAAVGFTGSYSGGTALQGYALSREKPIPVFAEMGSINPVVFLPDILKRNADTLAKQYAGSITLGVGQFCTNPGLLLALDGPELDAFLPVLSKEIEATMPGQMLHEGIHQHYYTNMEQALAQKGISVVGRSAQEAGTLEGAPVVTTVDGATFLGNPILHQEVFGPYSLLVRCRDKSELIAALKAVSGQLTTTLMATEADLAAHEDLITVQTEIAGRLILNGVPTGVEVCASMVHGGPFPATTDGRFTSVGPAAIRRWVRPVCFQGYPNAFLPDELKNENPRNIWRLVNNTLTRDSIPA